MTREQAKAVKRFKELAAKYAWKKSKSVRYKDAAHEYVVDDFVSEKDWDEMVQIIKAYGELRFWRRYKSKYLLVGELVYWNMGGIINCSYECSLDNQGFPGPVAQKKIFERFWGGVK